jgi:hypothetical protein
MALLPLRSAFLVLSLLSLAACGGSQPPAEDPSSGDKDSSGESPSEEAKSDEPEGDAKDEKKDDEKKDDEKKDEVKGPSDGPGPVTRTAKDMLTAPEVTFMFSFNQSEPKAKAEEKCQAQTKGEGKKMADCMRKASSKFGVDGMQFKQEKGTWYWITLRRKGATLTTLHKIAFEFGEEKPTSVTINPKGRDTGTSPMRNIPNSVTIEVPNEFSIALQDPAAGRLVYEAKIGITSADKGQ